MYRAHGGYMPALMELRAHKTPVVTSFQALGSELVAFLIQII